MHFLSFLFASLALIFSLPAAHAIDAGMPNPPSKPTIVKCGLFVLDIVDIDDVNETFEAEVAIVATWDDPRLAFDPVEEGTDKKIFQGEFQFRNIPQHLKFSFLIVRTHPMKNSSNMNFLKNRIF